MNKTLAEQTSLLLLQVSAKLDAQLRMLKTQCADEEFQVYLRGFGDVLGYMFTEIMTPIYAEPQPRAIHRTLAHPWRDAIEDRSM